VKNICRFLKASVVGKLEQYLLYYVAKLYEINTLYIISMMLLISLLLWHLFCC